MDEIYRNAFTEVYEILSYLEDDDYKKIPKSIIEVLSKNRNLDYKYYINESMSFDNQIMLPETKAILFNLFRDYLASSKQKEKIKNFQKLDRQKEEIKKDKNYKYNKNLFKAKENNLKQTIEKTSLVKKEENKWYKKLLDFIKRLWRKV